jgi:hypothetical protein
MRSDLRTSLRLFLDEIMWSERSDYRELLLGPHLWLNQRLARYYGATTDNEGFQKVTLTTGEYAGVLTHPYLLSAMAYSRTSSPIHRGVFLCRNILGVNLKNPSVAASFEDAKFDPSLTMREKVTSLTKNTNCAGCHALINPLGFTLENFDSVGRWRTTDQNKPIDPIVDYESEEGGTSHFKGPRDVAQHAVSSAFAHDAFIRHLFHHLVKQPPVAFGPSTTESLRKSFQESGFNIKQLVASIAKLKATASSADGPKVAETSR